MQYPDRVVEATEPEICELLAALVMVRQPRLVVEAGTFRGHAALAMADACRRTGSGRVVTFDPTDHGVQQYIDANGLREWCTYVCGPFTVPPNEPVDFAFVDASAPDSKGNMNARLRWECFEALMPRMSPGGLICAHDTLWPAEPWFDDEGGESMHRIRRVSALNLDCMRGLSVYQAPGRS